LFIICSRNGRSSSVYGPWYRSKMLTAAAQYGLAEVSSMIAAEPSMAPPRPSS
jgi:hypothetical protein